MEKIRSYSELILLPTFIERYEYLKLDGVVGQETFGYGRYANQQFYKSQEWRHVRDLVILRDNGCDLGVSGYEIGGRVYIHHMNPIMLREVLNRDEALLNPEYLICVTNRTHNAIHYGDERMLPGAPVRRSKNDTCLWKR